MNEYLAYFTATFLIDKLFIPMSCQLKSEIYFLVNLQRWTKKTQKYYSLPIFSAYDQNTHNNRKGSAKAKCKQQLLFSLKLLFQITTLNTQFFSLSLRAFCNLVAKDRLFPKDFTVTENIYKSVFI